jgi:tetratricopeptide (TPR) repeat protein
VFPPIPAYIVCIVRFLSTVAATFGSTSNAAACLLACFVCLFASHAPAQQSNITCGVDHSRPTRADLFFFRHDFAHAAKLYATAYAQDPTDYRSHLFLIESLLAAKSIDAAQRDARTWLAASPEDPYALIAAAEISYYKGDWAQYYALPHKALHLNPCLPIAYSDLGDFESLNGYRATARKHFALAHKLAPYDLSVSIQWIKSLDSKEHATGLDSRDRKTLAHRLNQLKIMLENRCELPRITHTVVIPMTPVYGEIGIKYYAVEVAFNGKKRLLQLDTGASGFLLTSNAGANLNLHTLDKTTVAGFGDQEDTSVAIARAASVTIGGVTLQNCPVDTFIPHDIQIGNNQGLIGTSVFQQALVTLDYRRHEVRLDPLPPPNHDSNGTNPTNADENTDWSQLDRSTPTSLESWTKIYRRGHHLIVPMVLSNGSRDLTGQLFILDTGAASDLIDIHLAKGFTRYKETTLTAHGLSGFSKNISKTGKLTADFAGLSIPVSSMQALDLSGFGGVAGFLGYQTLGQLVLHIDYRDNLISFDPPIDYR